MKSRALLGIALVASATTGADLLALQPQPPEITGAQFDVISIKLNNSGTMGGSGRELPDGTRMFTNRTIATIVAMCLNDTRTWETVVPDLCLEFDREL